MAGSKMSSQKGGFKWAIRVGIFAVAFYFLPHFLILFSSFTPFKITHTQAYRRLLDFRRSFLPERDPTPLPEIHAKDLTQERFLAMTKNLAHPVVIRGGMDKASLAELNDLDMWLAKYGNETVNCVDMSNDKYKACTIAELVDYNLHKGRNVYSRTNHEILYRRPELLEKLKNNVSAWISSDPPLYEIFMGFKDGASPLHAAFGVNLFKQLTGRKRWTFINPTWLTFTNLLISDDAASLLALPSEGPVYSTNGWLRKVPRYETIVEPGDMIFNPCVWMHIVENLPDAKNEKAWILGSPERHFGVRYGWKVSYLITSHLIVKKVLIELWRRATNAPKQVTASDFIPIHDLHTAAAFDKYIRGRAQALTGEFQ